MDSLGAVCVRLLEGLEKLKDGPLTIVETGTMFKTDLEPGETDLSARSTFAIASWMDAHTRDHRFMSIDVDYSHIEKCRDELGPLARHVAHMKGTGLDILEANPWFMPDFVLLDADSNADSTLAEFRAVLPRLASTAIVVVDDAFKHYSVNKAREIMPLVTWYKVGGAIAIPFDIEQTGPICEAVSRE